MAYAEGFPDTEEVVEETPENETVHGEPVEEVEPAEESEQTE